jgi:putative transposase
MEEMKNPQVGETGTSIYWFLPFISPYFQRNQQNSTLSRSLWQQFKREVDRCRKRIILSLTWNEEEKEELLLLLQKCEEEQRRKRRKYLRRLRPRSIVRRERENVRNGVHCLTNLGPPPTTTTGDIDAKLLPHIQPYFQRKNQSKSLSRKLWKGMKKKVKQLTREIIDDPNWGKEVAEEAISRLLEYEQEQRKERINFILEKSRESYRIIKDRHITRKLYTGRGVFTVHCRVLRKSGGFRELIPICSVAFGRYDHYDESFVNLLMGLRLATKSWQKVSEILKMMLKISLSAGTLSRLFSRSHADFFKKWRNRNLSGRLYDTVYTDATYIPVRGEGRKAKKALYILLGRRRNSGKLEVITLGLGEPESDSAWRDFLWRARKQGLRNVPLFVTDEHSGLIKAIGSVYPTSHRQRCIAHFVRNLRKAFKADKKVLDDGGQQGEEVKFSELWGERIRREVLEEPMDQDASIQAIAGIREEYRSLLPKTMRLLWKARYTITVHLCYDLAFRVQNRTTNLIERLNGEAKRAVYQVRCYPNRGSVEIEMSLICFKYNEERNGHTDTGKYCPGFSYAV